MDGHSGGRRPQRLKWVGAFILAVWLPRMAQALPVDAPPAFATLSPPRTPLFGRRYGAEGGRELAPHTVAQAVALQHPAAGVGAPHVEARGGLRLYALAFFGTLSCCAYGLRAQCQHRALRLALAGFGCNTALLSLAGSIGSRADVLGVPLFALLAIPALLSSVVAVPALTCALASVAELDANAPGERRACCLPGGARRHQMLAVGLGFFTVRSTISHLWTRSEMVPDASWAALGLLHYKAVPRPPTLTLLLGPMLLIGTGLRLGHDIYAGGRGADMLAGSLAMASGMVGPEASCVWSSHVGLILGALAAVLRLRHGSAIGVLAGSLARDGACGAGARDGNCHVDCTEERAMARAGVGGQLRLALRSATAAACSAAEVGAAVVQVCRGQVAGSKGVAEAASDVISAATARGLRASGEGWEGEGAGDGEVVPGHRGSVVETAKQVGDVVLLAAGVPVCISRALHATCPTHLIGVVLPARGVHVRVVVVEVLYAGATRCFLPSCCLTWSHGCIGVLLPQVAALVPQYLIRQRVSQGPQDKDAGGSGEAGPRTDVRIAANNLLVSPRLFGAGAGAPQWGGDSEEGWRDRGGAGSTGQREALHGARELLRKTRVREKRAQRARARVSSLASVMSSPGGRRALHQARDAEKLSLTNGVAKGKLKGGKGSRAGRPTRTRQKPPAPPAPSGLAAATEETRQQQQRLADGWRRAVPVGQGQVSSSQLSPRRSPRRARSAQ